MKCKIIGHRGVKSKILENTMESILHAIEMGVDGVEFDIHTCLTGEVVLFHDKTLDRLAFKDKYYFNKIQGKSINKLQWKQLNNAILIDTMGKQYKIPKLVDVLSDARVYNSDIIINIEIKDTKSQEYICNILSDLIDQGLYDPSRFLISSFNLDNLLYMDEFKKEDEKYENLKIGWIFSQESLGKKDLLNSLKIHSKVLTHVILEKIMVVNDDLVNINNVLEIISNEIGLKIYVYTVNEVNIYNKLLKSIDGIITDNPEIFL